MKPSRLFRILTAALAVAGAVAASADYLVSGRNSSEVGAIMRYDDSGALVGSFGEGQVSEPTGMAFDALGRLLVADIGLGTIEMFDRNGAYLGTFAKGLDLPIAVMQMDDTSIVAAEYLSGRIRHFGADGTDLGLFADTGLTRLYQLARSPITGFVCVAGLPEKVVLAYGQDGSPQGEFSDGARGNLESPGGIAFLPDGSLYVAEAHQNSLKLLDPSGNYVRTLSNTGIANPGFVTIDVNSDVLVANYDARAIRRFAPDGTDLGDFIEVLLPYHAIRLELVRQDLVPADYTVVRGVEIGTHDPLRVQQGNDANAATIEQRLQPTPALPNAELRATIAVPDGDPVRYATLDVRLQGNPLPLGTARSEVALRNWSTGLFETVYVENPMTDTQFRAIQVSLDAAQRAKYIRSDGSLEAAARMFQLGPISPAWRMKVSLVQLTVRR